MAHTTRLASKPSLLSLCLSLLLAAFITGPARAQTGNGLVYIYDELGRLVSVIDPAGETATYTYDAVGNVLSISRRSSSLVSVIEFTPNGGSVGDTVTIYGTGFSATASQNSVSFNGTAATITSATATRLVTSVPAGATTGPISVTSPAGSAASAESFTVGSPAAPTISGFSPTVGPAGTAVTVTGTNFQAALANNRVKFNATFSSVTAVTSTTISTAAPGQAGSGRVSVRTPAGTATSAADFFIPPPPRTAADVGFTGRMAVGDTSTATISAANKIGLMLFDGAAGQRVSLKMTGVTIGTSSCCSAFVSILKPNATSLISQTFVGTAGGFIDTATLPADGTYTILIEPQGTGTGSVTLALAEVPADATASITPGGAPVTLATTVAGQNARYTFDGTAGQRISLKMSDVTVGTSSCCSSNVSIRNPDGTNLVSPAFVGTSGSFIDTKTLPATGTYTILFDPVGTATGSAKATLYDVPADAAASITPGGSAVSVSTTVPGQNAALTFTGAAGQQVSLRMTGVTVGGSSCCSTNISIRKPDGTNLVSPTFVGTSGGFIDTKVLPSAGTYTIVLDPIDAAVGNVTFTLNDVPADITATIVPGGPPVTVSTTTPGQNALLTFTGTAGQRISLKMTGVSIGTLSCCSTQVSIKNPNGTNLVSPTFVGTSGGFIDVKTLAASGTYTILVDPVDWATGSMTLTLYDVPADFSGSISAGGAPVTVSTTVPGQNGSLTFNGSAGQRISLKMTGVTVGTSSCCSTQVSIRNPNGTNLVSPTFVGTNGGFIDVKTLAASGTYTIVVDPLDSSAGDITLTLYDVPSDDVGSITPGGPAVTHNVTVPGHNPKLTFTGAAGQRISLVMSGVTVGTSSCCSTQVSIRNPNGTNLVSPTFVGTSGGFFDTKVLAASGTYTLIVDPQDAATGNITLTLHDVPADASGTVTIGGAAASISTTVPGQNAGLTFSGASGQQATVRATGSTLGTVTFKLLKPDGTTLTTHTSFGGGSFNLSTQTLPATGTYTIHIDASGATTGGVSVSVTNP